VAGEFSAAILDVDDRHPRGRSPRKGRALGDQSRLTDTTLPKLNAFTVDVEDYFQVTAFESNISRESWDSLPSRVMSNTHELLELLASHQVRGTFFVLGWVARQFPGLVRDIQAAGHEIGSHSFWHRLIYTQTPSEFRADLRMSKQVLEDITGHPVTAFRAPSFSITKRSLWAVDVLAQEGFTTDSSIFPTHHDRYGIPGARREIHTLTTPSGSLLEFPPSIARWAGCSLPTGGGGYFRFYPYRLTRNLLGHINQYEQRPFMFYVHPWEVDPEQPRMRIGSGWSRFRHYVNLATTEAKLNRLLSDFSFGAMADVVAAQQLPVPIQEVAA
jgi:polysaccharide deacetylase family protein (PEP-CTERM system associated)